jgi:hypothetical protein
MTVQPNILAGKRQAGDQSRLLLRPNVCCGGASRQFQFHKSSQLFIGTHNETLSIIANSVCNKDSSPARIDSQHNPNSNRLW